MGTARLVISKLKADEDIDQAGQRLLRAENLLSLYLEKQRQIEQNTSMRVRKDAVRMLLLDIAVTGDMVQSFERECRRFASGTFCCGRKEFVLASRTRNADSTHIYIAVIPVTKDGRISAYCYLKNPAALRDIQRSFAVFVRSNGMDAGAAQSSGAVPKSGKLTLTKEGRLKQQIKDLRAENKMLKAQLASYIGLLEEAGSLKNIRELIRDGGSYQKAYKRLVMSGQKKQAEQLAELIRRLSLEKAD